MPSLEHFSGPLPTPSLVYGGAKYPWYFPLFMKKWACEIGASLRSFAAFLKKASVLKAELSEKALKLVGNPNVLINLVSRRVRQLNSGGNRPLIMETAGLSTAEIALTEIVEGKMSWESDLPKPKKKTRRRTRKA
jgi:DNA-directed RNA polymerase subunit omega